MDLLAETVGRGVVADLGVETLGGYERISLRLRGGMPLTARGLPRLFALARGVVHRASPDML
jgi:hypothetical protein